MRIVLDTNVLLRCLPKTALLRPLFDAIWQQRIQLVVSTPILLEYEEILTSRTSALVAQNVLQLLLGPAQAHLQTVYYAFGLITADPDDNKFVDTYVASAADYLVTDDRHFHSALATEFSQVRVVPAAEFLAVLEV